MARDVLSVGNLQWSAQTMSICIGADGKMKCFSKNQADLQLADFLGHMPTRCVGRYGRRFDLCALAVLRLDSKWVIASPTLHLARSALWLDWTCAAFWNPMDSRSSIPVSGTPDQAYLPGSR